MKITQNTRERLVIKDFPWAFGFIFLLMSGGLLFYGVKGLIDKPGVDKGVFAFIGLLFLMATVVFTKRSIFVFDLVQQQVTWSRLSLFGYKGGTISLGRITGCMVQTMQSAREAPTYRLALASPDGDLPLTDTYSTGSMSDRQKIREAIHSALGLPAPEPESTADIEDQIKALILNGQFIAAIKLVRDQRGCSLAEAKGVVDAMKSGSDSRTTS